MFSYVCTYCTHPFRSLLEQGVKIVLNQLYNASPLNDNQDTDTLPYYEEVGEARSPTTQYVNVSPSDSSMRDSMLVNNPIYGDEEANGSEERFYTAPVDHDDQTSERHGKFLRTVRL